MLRKVNTLTKFYIFLNGVAFELYLSASWSNPIAKYRPEVSKALVPGPFRRKK